MAVDFCLQAMTGILKYNLLKPKTNKMFRYIKMWDTETGQVCGRFSNKKMAFCAKFNPNDALQHLIVAGTSSNKIVCWDTR